MEKVLDTIEKVLSIAIVAAIGIEIIVYGVVNFIS